MQVLYPRCCALDVHKDDRTEIAQHLPKECIQFVLIRLRHRHLPRLSAGVLTAVMRAPFDMQSDPEESCS